MAFSARPALPRPGAPSSAAAPCIPRGGFESDSGVALIGVTIRDRLAWVALARFFVDSSDPHRSHVGTDAGSARQIQQPLICFSA